MKNVKTGLLVCMAILLSLGANAQVTKEFSKEVNLIKMTAAGVAIVGTNDALYGIDADGNELWKNEKLRKIEAERVEILEGSELIFVSDKGLGRNRIINVFTGQEYGGTDTKGVYILGARIIHGTNQLWTLMGGGSNPEIQVWDIESNQLLHSLEKDLKHGVAVNESAKLTSTFIGTQPITYTGESSAILHLGFAHLGEYNLHTGKPKWLFDWKPYKAKAPNGEKGITDSKTSRRFAVMKIDESDNTLYFPFAQQLIAIDASSGKPKWGPKEGKTGKVMDMYIQEDGILILTSKGLNLIDKATGEAKWSKPIKVKGADNSLLINDGNDFYAVSKKSVIAIDVKNKSSKVITEKIKFEGKESFGSLEMIDNLIVLGADQNAVGVDKNTGEIVYATYYKEPGQGLAVIAQNIALAAIAAAATMHSYQMGANAAYANNSSTVRYHQYTPAMIHKERSNTQDTGAITYMSTKFKDADAEGFGVARIDKKTGETTNKIVIDSREPVYAVDEIGKRIFYKSGKNGVEIKKLS